jgi:ferredoxin
MRAACRESLRARGAQDSAIREEVFVRPELTDDGAPLPTDDVTVSVRVGGEVREVIVAPGRTLLEAGLSAGAALPYSCTMGGCAACRVRLDKGEVRMEEPNCLTDEERGRGYILTCVSRPLSACEVEVDS